MKTCTKCGINKSLSAFYCSKKHITGRENQCKRCRRLRQLELPKIIVHNKICKECNQEKSSNQFHRNQVTRDGLATRCKDCERPRTNKRMSTWSVRHRPSSSEFVDWRHSSTGSLSHPCSSVPKPSKSRNPPSVGRTDNWPAFQS